MRRLTLATSATANPMGAQRYEREIVDGAEAFLPVGWTIRHEVFRSARSPLPGTRRVPMRWLESASPSSRRTLGRWAYGAHPDIVHRFDLALPPGPGRNVITLHDTVAWQYSDESVPIAAAKAELQSADAVICVSEFTASDAAARLGLRNAIVIPNGVDRRFFDAAPLSSSALKAIGVRAPYALHMGGASRRKNLEALADAWPIISARSPDLSLVLAGPPHPRRTALFGGLDRARIVGKVDDALIPGLIAGAEVVVIPSHYEGFGLPAIEAMAAGTTVVAADTSALTEVVSGAGILCAPTAPDVAEAVIEALSDSIATEALRAVGRRRATEYSWDRCLTGHSHVWQSLSG